MNTDDNWLHGERIICFHCGENLWRVDHSPFYDEAFLYCDTCPRHVEISYYDPHYQAALPMSARIAALRAQLRPCICGGRYDIASPRRCPTCFIPIIIDDPSGIDLSYWTPLLAADSLEATEAEIEREIQKMAWLSRTDHLWSDET